MNIVSRAEVHDGKMYNYSYDDKNSARQVSYDKDNDGVADGISTFYENENGQTEKGMYDYDGDGKIDSTSIFSYDDNGNLSTRYDDTDNDNIFDTIVSFEQDSENNTVEKGTQQLNTSIGSILNILSKCIDRLHNNAYQVSDNN